MNEEKRIEQCLRAAPEPAAPEGLLGRLRRDVALSDARIHHSALRRWFAPAGGPLSRGRIAAAAILAAVVLLPLSYAGTKIVYRYFTEGPKVEVIREDDGSVRKVGSLSVSVSAPAGGSGAELTEEKRQEIMALREAGEFERTLVREWSEQGMEFRMYQVTYTLSSGEAITTTEVEAGSSSGGSNP